MTTGIFVPLYVDPSDLSWTACSVVKAAYPSVPIVCIVNPNNGVGAVAQTSYVTGIKALQASGVVVIGYVSTRYGARPAAEILSEVDVWKSWYGVDGVFFDEVQGHAAYYASFTAHAKSIGMTFCQGNPGTTAGPNVLAAFDDVCTFENAGYPAGYVAGQSTIAYGVSYNANQVAAALAAGASYVYFTNQSGGNPYLGVPTYFTKLAAALAGVVQPPPPPPSTTVTMAVPTGVTVLLNGKQVFP